MHHTPYKTPGLHTTRSASHWLWLRREWRYASLGLVETGAVASCELGDGGFGWASTASMTGAPRVMASWTGTPVPSWPLTHLRTATLYLLLNPLRPSCLRTPGSCNVLRHKPNHSSIPLNKGIWCPHAGVATSNI